MLVSPHSKTVANEGQMQVPSLMEADGTINSDYMKDFSDWFDKNFGLRSFLIGTEHRLMAAVFGESSEKKVILGSDGWLFYAETLDDYQGTNLMTKREIYSIAGTLELMDEYCKSNGMKFVFVPVPNKNTLYPHKMPAFYPAFSGRTNMDMVKDELKNTGVDYVDLETAFTKEKVLYRKTDSHWTTEGAGFASDCILDVLGREHEKNFGAKTHRADGGSGDLYDMLYVYGRDYDKDVVYDKGHNFRYERPIRSFEDNFINTVCDGKTDRLYMFRDSFGNTLHPFLADEFGHAVFTRVLPFDLVGAKQDGADFVILELVERNIERIITEGAVFPAPVRDIDIMSLKKVNAKTKLLNDGHIDGYVRLDGELDAPPDTYGNIIVVSGGTSYQATPRGDRSFSAYIPNTKENKISIYLTR